MSRSVEVPVGAHTKVFFSINDDEYTFEEWEDLKADISEALMVKFPSMYRVNRRYAFTRGRETQTLLTNEFAEVTISYYGGVAVVCLVPTYSRLSLSWCDKIARKFRKALSDMFGDSILEPVATASNGETFYRRVK